MWPSFDVTSPLQEQKRAEFSRKYPFLYGVLKRSRFSFLKGHVADSKPYKEFPCADFRFEDVIKMFAANNPHAMRIFNLLEMGITVIRGTLSGKQRKMFDEFLNMYFNGRKEQLCDFIGLLLCLKYSLMNGVGLFSILPPEYNSGDTDFIGMEAGNNGNILYRIKNIYIKPETNNAIQDLKQHIHFLRRNPGYEKTAGVEKYIRTRQINFIWADGNILKKLSQSGAFDETSEGDNCEFKTLSVFSMALNGTYLHRVGRLHELFVTRTLGNN